MKNHVYRVQEKIIIEGFEDGALALRMPDRNIFELNLTAFHILENTDGVRSVNEVAALIADAFKIPEDDALKDVISLYQYLESEKIVECVN